MSGTRCRTGVLSGRCSGLLEWHYLRGRSRPIHVALNNKANTLINGTWTYLDGSVIKSDKKDIHNVILLEELFHAYQRQRLGDATYNKRRLNCEIEAKLAWIMYRQRTDDLSGNIEIGAGIGGKLGKVAFESMADAIRFGAPLIFKEAYVKAAIHLKANSNTYYKYSYIDGDQNISILKTLIQDCIKKNEL